MSDLSWCPVCDKAINAFSDSLYCSEQCLRADALRNHPLLGYTYHEFVDFPRPSAAKRNTSMSSSISTSSSMSSNCNNNNNTTCSSTFSLSSPCISPTLTAASSNSSSSSTSIASSWRSANNIEHFTPPKFDLYDAGRVSGGGAAAATAAHQYDYPLRHMKGSRS